MKVSEKDLADVDLAELRRIAAPVPENGNHEDAGETIPPIPPSDRRGDFYARWSYEQLILRQPHVKYEGLWRLGGHYFIVCPELSSSKTADGKNLVQWFDYSCRVVSSPVQLVDEAPPEAERVSERSAGDRTKLVGAPRTMRDCRVDLSLLLPREFPEFDIAGPGKVALVTARELTSEEKQVAADVWASLGDHPALEFTVSEELGTEKQSFRYHHGQGDIDLVPSRWLPTACGRALRWLIEEDEDFWVAARERALSVPSYDPEEVLPVKWRGGVGLSCLVDATVSPPENLRTYLSLYQTVVLAIPLEDRLEPACRAMGVSDVELRTLVEMGRVKLLLPQAIDRYPVGWLNSVADSAPGHMLLSRRLAAATVLDARRRLPILYPPLSPRERYSMLHAAVRFADSRTSGQQRDALVQLASELGDAYAHAEWSVHTRGAMGTSHLGVGLIASVLYERLTGRDLRLELWSAAMKVEWAAALRSHVFPSNIKGYDEARVCDLLAGLYSPTLKQPPRLVPPDATIAAVTGLLALDSTVPVVDFAREFGSADISRLRELVLRLARENVDPDYLRDAIERFNADVRHYERRPDALKAVNLVGLLGAGAVAAGIVDESVRQLVPLASVALGFALNRLLGEAPKIGATGKLVDFANAALAGRPKADIVLVARSKRELSRLKG